MQQDMIIFIYQPPLHYNNQLSVMIRRRSTLDHAQRIKHNKQVQIFSILDLCLQLPSDDRIMLRNQIKSGDEQLQQRVYQCKKDKNYHSLQIYLRKYIQKIKESDRFRIDITKSNNRGRTPQTLKSLKNQTQSSYHNSLKSSPSNKKTTNIEMERMRMVKHIQNEIDREVKKEIQKQDCQHQLKDITPRQIQIKIKPMNHNKDYTHQIDSRFNNQFSDVYTLIKKKIDKKENYCDQTYINCKKSTMNTHKYHNDRKNQDYQARPPLNLMLGISNRFEEKKVNKQEHKYGEFNKRIKQAIKQAY